MLALFLKLINIQNNDKVLANDIRMMIYNEFKSTKKLLIAKFLIDSLFFEDISAFFEYIKNNYDKETVKNPI